jgi:hypothetical protein
MTQLKYHQKAYDLLTQEPVISSRALELLARIEQQCGIVLPQSVREWYSFEGAVQILATHSNRDHPTPLDRLGKIEQIRHNADSRDSATGSHLLIMTENQGVCRWAIELDGSDDPPVVVKMDSASEVPWQPCADTFSTFVYTQVWDWQRLGGPILCAQDRPLTQDVLCVLRQRFAEGPTTYGWPGSESHRFGHYGQRILIWSSEEQADWFLSAATPELLLKLARTVWDLGGLSHTLYGVDPAGEQVLRSASGGLEEGVEG